MRSVDPPEADPPGADSPERTGHEAGARWHEGARPAAPADPAGRGLGLSDAEFAVANARVLGVAYRMLGSWVDAEDVAAQTWLRWHQSRPSQVAEPVAWLTTVATRVSLDVWRSAARRRESYIGPWLPEPVDGALLPQEAAAQRETLSLALLHLMERLTPAERAVYVLRHAFGYAYPEIAAVLERSPAGCRQLGRRAQAKIGRIPARVPAGEHRAALDRLAAAVRSGRVSEAVALISEDAVLITDAGGHTKAALRPVRGADNVARFLIGVTTKLLQPEGAAGSAGAGEKAEAVRIEPIDVNGDPGYRVTGAGQVRVFSVTVGSDGLIRAVFAHSNPEKVSRVQAVGRS